MHGSIYFDCIDHYGDNVLKQHSVLDVMAGFLMAYTLYQFIYAPEANGVRKPARQTLFVK